MTSHGLHAASIVLSKDISLADLFGAPWNMMPVAREFQRSPKAAKREADRDRQGSDVVVVASPLKSSLAQ
jgi:hypothetical protein